MAALRKLFSLSIFTVISSSISSLWKKPKDGHDPPPTPLQQLIKIRSFGADDLIQGDVVVDVEAAPPTSPSPSSQLGLRRRSPQLPTSTPALPSASIPATINNIDSYSKHIRKMVVTVAIFLITFSGLLIVNPPDINLMNDTLPKSMASISDALVLATFCFGAWLILHSLLCVRPSDQYLNDIWVQKGLMLIGVVFMALSLLFRTLVTPSRPLLVLVSWVPALLIVSLAFVLLRMLSNYKFSAGMAAPAGLDAGGMGNLPV